MKVTLDLDKLLQEGKIDQLEYNKLSQQAARSTSALGFNILIGFGISAVSLATLAIVPYAGTAIVIGLLVCGIGIGLIYLRREQWTVLSNVCIGVGALQFGGGIIAIGNESIGSFLIVAMAFGVLSVVARSSLLSVLAVLALSSSVGAGTAYSHAAYYFGVEQPATTVVLFTFVSVALYQLSKRLSADYQRVAIAAARTGVFLVNLGFWIGSLFGDNRLSRVAIADWVFAMMWAIALIAAGAWAWINNRRWMVNVVAVFGGIHFYTQWFEKLGASPGTIMIAGLLALGFAIGLKMLNTNLGKEGEASSPIVEPTEP